MIQTKTEIINLLSEIYDPEIPVINIVEMGILRNAFYENEKLIIEITPTYSGCPAMKVIEDEILDLMHSNGYKNVEVKKSYLPAWTTDWMNLETKNKLREYGIAPPENRADVECPFCGSSNTKLTSIFGSTACKSLHFCNSCVQPFERFKCI
ncbi:MAG: phenylacetate-CoA oxygenase subunit PaaJ [Ignavibacteriales bacterium]|nr:phenylacetate-CoA oxygenase subunit PaaJ [Ignavibacteriales bacterium]